MPSVYRTDADSPRVVELFGPSSGGKSTLGAKLRARCTSPAVRCADERILAHVHLGWLPGHLLRTLALDAVALVEVLATWRDHAACYRRAASQALCALGPRHSFERLMLLRNAWKGVALARLAAAIARPDEVLLLDEGPLQTANYLFVHVDVPPAREALDAYLAVLPLAEAALFVAGDEEQLVERTLSRRHARVKDGSPEAARRFVRHAVEVFECILGQPRVAERLVPLERLAPCDSTREACA